MLYVSSNGQKRDTIVGRIYANEHFVKFFFPLPNTISGVFSATLVQLAVDTPRCSGVHIFNSSRTSAIERLHHLKNHAKSKNYSNYCILLACIYRYCSGSLVLLSYCELLVVLFEHTLAMHIDYYTSLLCTAVLGVLSETGGFDSTQFYTEITFKYYVDKYLQTHSRILLSL